MTDRATSGPDNDRQRTAPPRLAELLLRALVGATATGRSILGDAREELATRTDLSPRRARLWYWSYVLRFAATYRLGAGRQVRPARSPQRTSTWDGIISDLRRSAVALLARPWLSAAVVSTLAIGIGATTLTFAIADGVLLRPLPFPASERLVDVSRLNPEWYGPDPTAAEAGNVFATPAATYFDWQRASTSFSALGAYAWTTTTFTGDAAPERIVGAVATAGLFEALGVSAPLGRHLLPVDDEPGATRVVVLGYWLWQRRFGADPSVIGSTVRLGGEPTLVVGVMPRGFAFPDEQTQFWVALDDESRADPMRNAGYLHALGRLAPGVTLAQARSEIAGLQRRLGEAHAEEAKFIAAVHSRQELVVAAARPRLLLLLGAALIVLVVGCANVASLLLARVTQRRREIAVHAALGAGRRRLARLLLGESTLLALAGGALGVAGAWWALRPVVAAFPMALPRKGEIAMDLRLLTLALLASLAVGLLLGWLPVLRAHRLDLQSVLKNGGHGSTGGQRTSRSHGLLVVCEVALSVVLLMTLGGLVASYLESARKQRGFETDDVLVLRLSVAGERAESEEQIQAYYAQLLERLDAIPGVEATALAQQAPYAGCCSTPPASVRTPSGIREESLHTSAVTPSYFETMGIPLRAGRGLEASDHASSPPVVVVSEALAQRYWPGESSLGQQIRLDSDQTPRWHRVVGVVGNVRYSFGSSAEAEYYRAFAQSSYPSQAVFVKTLPGAVGVPSAAERAVHTVDPNAPVTVRPLAELAAADYGYRNARIGLVLISMLTAIATGLALLGVYSVLAYGVLQRTREIGIRVSLGGSRVAVLRSVLGGGLAMTAIGLVLGIALSWAGSALVGNQIVGASAPSPWVLLAVVATMMVTSASASLIPAWRAARVDPLVAFRE